MQDQDTGRTIGAVVLIVVGAMFLLGQVTGFDFMGSLWPMFVMAPGLIFLAASLFGGQQFVPLIFPGLIVTGTGAILFLQNIGLLSWESWSYIWAIYPGLVGTGLMYVGTRQHDGRQIREGRRLVTIALIGLVIFGGFFELFIFGSLDFELLQYLIPVVLIVAGVFMLFMGRGGYKRKSKNDDWA